MEMEIRVILHCLIGCIIFLISCNEIEQRKTNIENNNKPFYMINLPDTINAGVPVIFDIKLSYPNIVKNEHYFSFLILSDSTEITLDNILEKTDNPYEILEANSNHWKVRRTFHKKGNFNVRGAIYVSTIDFKDIGNDSLQVKENKDLIQIKRKVHIK